MDYRAFLGGSEPVVLPYFGGSRVDARERRFQLDAAARAALAPGWWRFRIVGRRAEPIEPAPAESLAPLPAVRGHWADGWVVVDGRAMWRVALAPDDEPAPLSRVTARRWYSGDHVLDTVDFEDDAEVAARLAVEQQRALGDVKGATPSLRVAFAVVLGGAVARAAGTPVSPRELVSHAVAIADGGPDVVRARLAALAAERARAAEAARRRAAEIALADRAQGARVVERHHDPVQRADAALDGAKARMLACRRLARNTQLDVTYDVDGARIMTIVDSYSLQVIDPGVCLGHDDEYRALTLDAMPSVVREAIDQGRLNITRRA
jgi:hypothetical protein